MPSIQRKEEQFLGRTLASLVDTLQYEERQLLHIVVLLADTYPENHSAFEQAWLENIADEVLVYNVKEGNASDLVQPSPYRRIPWHDSLVDFRQNVDRVEHMRRDDAAVIAACQRTESSYFALVEDDIIAARDWFHRTREATVVIERSSKTNRDWLYMRLFYTELYMGWNTEEWPIYPRNSFALFMGFASMAFLLRRCLFKASSITDLRGHLLNSARGKDRNYPRRTPNLVPFDATVLVVLLFGCRLSLYFTSWLAASLSAAILQESKRCRTMVAALRASCSPGAIWQCLSKACVALRSICRATP